MKTLSCCLFFLFSFSASAQYYYNDIIGTREINREMQTYLEQKVKTVSATGIDPRGVKNTQFSEYREVYNNGTALKTSRVNLPDKTTSYLQFDRQGRVISIRDSSSAVINTTRYEYNQKGLVAKIENSVIDSSGNFNQVETHHWFYGENDKPAYMWRVIKNSGAEQPMDSLQVKITLDEDGNPGEERNFRQGVETAYLYYYYDNQQRLTDIVRYNRRFKKLVPDVMFEYDEQDRVIQKLTTTSGQNLGYLIWRYIFNEKGLKSKEALFNNDKQLTGRIEYSYTFGQ